MDNTGGQLSTAKSKGGKGGLEGAGTRTMNIRDQVLMITEALFLMLNSRNERLNHV